MSIPRFRLRGSIAPTPPASSASTAATPDDGLVAIASRRTLIPGRARDGVSGELEVAGDEVVRVELDNGFVLWTRADALVREHGRRSRARDGGDAWEIDALAPSANAATAERGLLGLGVRVLEFFGVRVKEGAARKLGEHFEERQLKPQPPGLHRVSLADRFALAPLAADAKLPGGGPLL
ncbi:MAG TPA: hypothetical protein PK101_03975, partial [Thauera sp.]|nr:hypothetical protein [Thauera sp.]